MLSKRLYELSCNCEEFAKAATPYNIAMKTRGNHGGLTYDNHATDIRARRNRKLNIVWFNPPFSENVKNNIGKLNGLLLIEPLLTNSGLDPAIYAGLRNSQFF